MQNTDTQHSTYKGSDEIPSVEYCDLILKGQSKHRHSAIFHAQLGHQRLHSTQLITNVQICIARKNVHVLSHEFLYTRSERSAQGRSNTREREREGNRSAPATHRTSREDCREGRKIDRAIQTRHKTHNHTQTDTQTQTATQTRTHTSRVKQREIHLPVKHT
jgi:hypothetical protein